MAREDEPRPGDYLIHRLDPKDGDTKTVYVISSHHVWMTGVYESERAARYAFRFCDDLLGQLRENSHAIAYRDGDDEPVITFEQLREMKRKRGYLCGVGFHAVKKP